MTTVRDAGPPPLHRWPAQACIGTDPALFFPEGHPGGAAQYAERPAKRICHGCEARQACRDYAVPIENLVGIWGGMNANERTRERKQRGT